MHGELAAYARSKTVASVANASIRGVSPRSVPYAPRWSGRRESTSITTTGPVTSASVSATMPHRRGSRR
jgi:hypothetical protein